MIYNIRHVYFLAVVNSIDFKCLFYLFVCLFCHPTIINNIGIDIL